MDSPKGLPLDVARIISGKFVLERHLKNGSILVSCDEDGSVMPYRVCFGKNMTDQARHIYLNAKEHKRIVECI